MALFKKSTGNGLFQKAEPKLAKRHGAPQADPANFPTSEDLDRGEGFDDAPQDEPDADTRFLHYGERVNLQSSFMASAEYEHASGTLIVTFHHGGATTYTGVPAHVALELTKAPSAGSYYNSHIKGRYPAS